MTNSLTAKALELLNEKSFSAAEVVLRDALTRNPRDPDVLQLLGLALKNLGQLEGARDMLLRSLAVSPNQPHVHNNLGGVYLRLGELAQARASFEDALKLDRTHKDAWRNLALTFRRLGDLDKADLAARHAVSLDPDFAPGLALLGQIRLDLGEPAEATAFLSRATNLNPNVLQNWHNLGAALRAAGKLHEASNALQMALKIQPRSAETYGLLGAVFQDMGETGPAKEAYRIATEAAPNFEEAHFAYNQILWMDGETGPFLKSYEKAESQLADASDIRCAHAQTLVLLDRFSEAEAVLKPALSASPQNIRVNHTMGRVLTKLGRLEEAARHHDIAVRNSPGTPHFRASYARTLMLAGEYRDALIQLEACPPAATRAAEMDQEIIALTFLCARELGLAQADRLYDYGRFVRAHEIPVPDGFRSIDAFNAALAEKLESLHTTKHEPIEQTLRGGTQTHGRLFQSEDPLIKALQGSIQRAVEQYLMDLPDIPGHPFGEARPDACKFAGSWSVRLRDQGFHKNHFHSRGWLSSAYYVSLPSIMSGEAGDRAGWLKFGQPNELPGYNSEPDHWIRPEAGQLALFPSYMWHGTEPFSAKEPRLTVAFDVQSKIPTLRQIRTF